ncbi:hypothetical protein DSO57_1014952 [Entomophthora muscae]|uniref:Uncharacterized protein n=1 Tax=Entomophthora muscae TaxID=34485 RepID=A0ACC2TH18_9FUNG|nr:hypothetical protein DSO57_1014952 [Entomophthora muscae]
MKGLILFQVFAVVAEYDYIVVGSGPGGGTLATELAIKGFKTLLIEAGPHHFEANQSTPAFQARASEDPNTAFEFQVNHYTNDTLYFYPRAGVLGGCSVHNAMITVYPNTRDFKLMQDITDDANWSEQNMRSHFRRMENNQYMPNWLSFDHGFKGWFKTSYVNFLVQLKMDPALVNLFISVMGNPFYDLNGRGYFGLNTDSEARVFVPQAIDKTSYTRTNFPKYIYEVSKKHPLTVWTDTFVTKVLFEGNVAVGVEYKKGKYLYKASPLGSEENRQKAITGTVNAKREIILSGGTFNTPQILMLSGIGDQDHLQEFEIPVVSHVPGVGRNMMDRYEISIVSQYEDEFNVVKGCQFTPSSGDPCYKEYIEKRTGPYTSNGLISGQLKKSNPNLKEPDLFILNSLSDFHGYHNGYSKNVPKTLNSSTRLILKAHTNNTNGHVKLLSSNPFDVPDINFHSFSDGDSDLNILVHAIRAEREHLRESIFIPHKELYPGDHVQTDEEIRQYIKANAWGHHACCTAKMGTPDDPTAVVDAKFRVRGVKNLRVVDMSIFPKIPGYFPHPLHLHDGHEGSQRHC